MWGFWADLSFWAIHGFWESPFSAGDRGGRGTRGPAPLIGYNAGMSTKNRNCVFLVLIGFAVNVVAAAIPLTLLGETSGSAIRPMGHAAMMFAWSGAEAIIMAAKSLSLIAQRQWRLAIGELVMAATPFLVTFGVFRIIVDLKDFTLKP